MEKTGAKLGAAPAAADPAAALTTKPSAPAAAAPAASSPWVTYGSLIFLFFNCACAIYNSRDDPWQVAFVIAAFSDLLVLLYFFRLLEETPREAADRRFRLRVAVWVSSTVLTLMFAAKVAAMMPLAIAVAVWAMSGGTVAACFYLFFLYKVPSQEALKKASDAAAAEKKLAAAA